MRLVISERVRFRNLSISAGGVWDLTGVSLLHGSMLEIVWLVAWYVGLLQRAPFLDIAGSTPQAIGRTAPVAVVLVACALVALAALARSRRLRG